MKKIKSILASISAMAVVAGTICGIFWMQNWTVRFKSEFDRFFGKDNWEYISEDIEKSMVYTTYHRNRSNPMLSGRRAGYYRDWNISFTNRYGEEELWTVSNQIYKINHQDYKHNWFHPNRFTAKQALTRELMDISFEMVGEEVMNEIVLDVLTEEEASCMEITVSYEGGNPKPKVYDALRKEPWFKANEITAADYLATDIYDFHLFIRVHDYRMEKLTEEQRQHVVDSFEVIQDKLQETYGEHTAYEMFWGDGRTAKMKKGEGCIVENQQEDGDIESENRYESFLNGEELLFFNKYNHYDFIDDEKYFEEEKGYTLSEIVSVLTEHYYEYTDTTEMDSISYAYIDCGNDGVEELAICFNGMDIYCQDDDSNLVYIIKDIDNQLELCYLYETWARSRASINEYGYFKSSGSGGATKHGADYGLVDKNGDWKFIVSEEEELDISFVNYPEELSEVANVAAGKTYEGIIAFYTITLADNKEGGRYVATSSDDNIYSFEVFDDNYEKITEPYMYTDSVYKEIFDEAGVTVLSSGEIEKIIAEKEKEVGLTEEIRNGQQIEWTIMGDSET